MTNTTKIVLAASGSVVSSAIIGVLCYFKGRRDGHKHAKAQYEAQLTDGATQQSEPHTQHARA